MADRRTAHTKREELREQLEHSRRHLAALHSFGRPPESIAAFEFGAGRDLALSVMVVHGDEGVRPGVPFQLAFRRVLEEAGSVAEARALLEATPRTVTNNLMLVGADGEARVLELHPERVDRLLLLCPAFDVVARWPTLIGPDNFERWREAGRFPLSDRRWRSAPKDTGRVVPCGADVTRSP